MEHRLLAIGRGLGLGLVALLLGLLVWKVAHRPAGAVFVRQVQQGEKPEPPAFDLAVFQAGNVDTGSSLRSALAGGRVSAKALASGRPVVVNFFASWCPPCKEEAPLLAKTARRVAPRVTVVGIASTDLRSDLRRFLSRYGTSYPVLFDGPGNAERAWGVAALPETFVVSSDGRVVRHEIGRLDEAELAALLRTAERS